MNHNIYLDGWESRLEQYALMQKSRCRAYICSPLSAASEKDLLHNIRMARAYMLYAMENMGCKACAPHAYLPILLDDSIGSDRELALEFGLQLLEHSDLLLVCGVRVSTGMAGEINRAISHKIPVVTFHEATYEAVKQLAQCQGSWAISYVSRNWQHTAMGTADPVSYEAELYEEKTSERR